jgi:hypothetical protein
MRSKNRNILVALVAMLALGAVTSASASAAELPELALKAGEKGTLTELAFAGTTNGSGGGSGTWEVTKDNQEFLCGGGVSISGKAVNAKTVTAVIKFSSCTAVGSHCQSVHRSKENEIVTEELTGTLAYISKAAKTVGFVFTPKTGTALTEFTCADSGYLPVDGSIILPLGNVNVLRYSIRELGVVLSHSENGVQVTNEYEGVNRKGVFGKIKAGLETLWPDNISWKPLAWEFREALLGTNKEVEIKA